MSQAATEKVVEDQPSGDESIRNKSEAPESAPTYDGETSGNADGEDEANKKTEAKGSLRDYVVSRDLDKEIYLLSTNTVSLANLLVRRLP